METTFYKGGKVAKGEYETDFLGDIVRVRLLRHSVRMYETNQRSGTHSVKGRSDLAFRKSALFKQKGTGRARVRHPQATQCRSGGVPHGPKVRDYTYHMPRRAKVEALRSALLSKFRDGEVAVIDSLQYDAPRTKTMISMLNELGMRQSCLIVTDLRCDNVLLSARNLNRIHIVRSEEVNAYHLLFFKNLIITEGALEQIKEKTTNAS
ncbi:MAG: large subunit ribosomal protein L4 [Planctomycetota bacterium]|jgi:large subunit ribosomal protein L4